MDHSDEFFEVPEQISLSAARVANVVDYACKRDASSPDGLSPAEFTSVLREAVAFFVHFVDFTLFHTVGPIERSRVMNRVGEMLNQILSGVELWENTKFMPMDEVGGIRVFRGFDHDFVNARVAEYGELTTPDGDYSESIDRLAQHIVWLVPEGSAEDARKVAAYQVGECLECVWELIT
jgi:hypothetical protein